ncbi:hypothetical protein [Shewanella bicestrii]|nr:hypothetical protein [Shewanella bicestrii]
MLRLDELVNQIICINHAWKLSKEEFGNDFVATKSLRDTKASLQATLLREFPTDSYLMMASDSAEHDEAMYSVRLKSPVVIGSAIRTDAEHLPQRIAHDILTEQELYKLLK